ncbi:hypothetical protein OQA88_5934 [Cercophora sp. LCS_1]
MTILLLTFEFMQGNMDMADGLITTSIQLLGTNLSQYRRTNSRSPKLKNARAEEDVAEIEYMLPFLSIMGGWTPFLKTQRSNLALWDTLAGDYVPDPVHINPRLLQGEWTRFFSRASAFTGRALVMVSQARSVEIDPALSQQQQTYLSHLQRWQQALDVALHHACIVVNIGLRCCLDYTDMAWDEFDNDFARLLDECLSFAIEVPRPAYHARFTLSMGILSTLGPAIAKCRNHNIRMQALEMARKMPWREGSWDAESELFGKLGAVLLEEEGRNVDGKIPPQCRWTWLDGEWDTKRGTLIGQYKLASHPVTLTPEQWALLSSLAIDTQASLTATADSLESVTVQPKSRGLFRQVKKLTDGSGHRLTLGLNDIDDIATAWELLEQRVDENSRNLSTRTSWELYDHVWELHQHVFKSFIPISGLGLANGSTPTSRSSSG